MANRLGRRITRLGPELVLALVVLLSAVSLWQAWNLARHLRSEARDSSRIFGGIVAALNNPTPGGDTQILLRLVADIRATGLPMVITDSAGRPTAAANTPFDASLTDPALGRLARELDRDNPPIDVPGVGQVHFGALRVANRLNLLAMLQLGLLVAAIAAGLWAYRTAMHRDRDRLWVAMARESAHQLGTPLMSAEAWIERLEAGSDPTDVAGHLKADLERLQRVAQRFERIGRPARRDRVALGSLAERVAAYFEPRLPRRAHHVRIQVRAPEAGPFVSGDPVLLEWATEALVRNAIDALSGRGGTITISVAGDDGSAVLRVADDGPGIDPEIRARIFEPGVTTKRGGWGIGLALARRIVQDVHDGALTLGTPSAGTEFVMRLPGGHA